MTARTAAGKKDCACKNNLNIVPVCAFVGLLSAILVVLVFSVVLVIYQQAQQMTKNATYDHTFASEVNAGNTDSYGIIELSASGVMSMSQNGASGFLIISASGDSTAQVFKQKVTSSYDLNSVDNIYSFEVPKVERTSDEASVLNWLDNPNANAALIYIKNGAIYDRLDDINSESDISTFLTRYK